MSKNKQSKTNTSIQESIDNIFSGVELVKEQPKEESAPLSFFVEYNPAIVSLRMYTEWLQMNRNLLKDIQK